jgi:hypothetical protein
MKEVEQNVRIGRQILWFCAVPTLLILVLFAALIYFSVSSFLSAEVVVLRTVEAPGRAHVAVLYEVRGNATVPFNSNVAILSAGEEFDPDHPRPAVAVRGRDALQVVWLDADRLQVTMDPKAEIYRWRKDVGGIQVLRSP